MKDANGNRMPVSQRKHFRRTGRTGDSSKRAELQAQRDTLQARAVRSPTDGNIKALAACEKKLRKLEGFDY